MEQFLTGDIWNQVNKLLKKRQKKTACIAYVTSDQLKLSKGDILICDASDFSIKFGQTSAKTLESYHNNGVIIYSNTQLHSKLLLTDSFLVIGSANLSKSSAEKLTESSIITESRTLVSQAKAFCYTLMSESIFLEKGDIDRLMKIDVVKRQFKPQVISKTREKVFGNKYWYVSASLLGERSYEKIRETVEKVTATLSKKESIEEEDISFLRWKVGSTFSKMAKEGDQIVLKFNNKSKNRTIVFKPSTILKKEVVNGYVYFYHDDRNSEQTKISWARFQTILKKINLGKLLTNRTKVIQESDINKILTVWK